MLKQDITEQLKALQYALDQEKIISANLRAELEARYKDISVLGRELSPHGQRQSPLHKDIVQETLLQQLCEQEAKHVHTLRDLHNWHDKLHETERQRDSARNQVKVLENRRSWRLLTPLRWMKRLFSGNKSPVSHK